LPELRTPSISIYSHRQNAAALLLKPPSRPAAAAKGRNDMKIDGKQYKVAQKIPINAPPEYKQHAVEATRRKASNELYNILYSFKLPAVVDIEEISYPSTDERPYYDTFDRTSEFRIVMTVNPVQYRHIEMAVMPELDYRIFAPVSKNPIKRTIQRLGAWLMKVAR
jgi:hypothetical protein